MVSTLLSNAGNQLQKIDLRLKSWSGSILTKMWNKARLHHHSGSTRIIFPKNDLSQTWLYMAGCWMNMKSQGETFCSWTGHRKSLCQVIFRGERNSWHFFNWFEYKIFNIVAFWWTALEKVISLQFGFFVFVIVRSKNQAGVEGGKCWSSQETTPFSLWRRNSMFTYLLGNCEKK